MKTFMINGVGQMREGNVFLEPIFFTWMKLNDQFQLQYTTSGNFGSEQQEVHECRQFDLHYRCSGEFEG